MCVKILTGLFLANLFILFGNCVMGECCSQSNCEKVTIIYIHGIYEIEKTVFERQTNTLHKYFANKKLGRYVINENFKRVYWGDLPPADEAYKIHASGLKAMNMDHNRWRVKNTTKPKPSLVLNPFVKYCLVGDFGSKSSAVFLRNIINNYIYEMVWLVDDLENKNKIYGLIEKKIEEINGKYILVGYSVGSVIAARFIMDRIVPEHLENSPKKYMSDNFIGLITGGDVNNSIQSITWNKELKKSNYEQNQNNFIKYFIENDKFWISYNHRNDIFSTKLSTELGSHNIEGNGFIISETKKGYPFEGIVNAIAIWDRGNKMILSHLYILFNPKSYVNDVIKIYDKAIHEKQCKCNLH